MIQSKNKEKQRVNSVYVSAKKVEKMQGVGKSGQQSSQKRLNREKRIKSTREASSKKGEKKKQEENLQPKEEQQKVKSIEENSNHHFMTVADLTSGDFVQPASEIRQLQTPVNQYHQQSTLKGEYISAKQSNFKAVAPLSMEKQLDQTIGKLRTKQATIDMFNKTIQTRLVEGSSSKLTASNRLDIYEMEMNFYVQRISQLQKQLHEKNRELAGVAEKKAEFGNLVKNNRKLIGQNHRLRQERELLFRENEALKKILLKRGDKKV